MRIAHVTFGHYLRDARVRRACEALAGRGDEVVAFSLAEAGQPDEETIRGVRLERVPVERLSLSTRQTKARYAVEYGTFGASVAARLWKHHRRRPFDLVHVNNMPDLLVVAAAPLKLLGVPVILDVHDIMPDLYVSKYGASGSALVVRALAAQLVGSAAFADAVLTVSEPCRRLIAGHGVPEERVHVVVNAPDDAVFTRRGFKEPGEGFVMAYHGSISKRHGLDVALTALAQARDRLPAGTRLKVVGQGDALSEVLALRERLELNDVVEITPHFIPVEALPEWLADVDLGLSPYRRDPATEMMLPCKLLDYGTVGIPVVVTRLSTVSAYFDERSVTWLPEAQPAALAEAMVRLAGDPELRRRQVDALEEAVAKIAWPAQRATYLELVDAVAAGRIRRPVGRALGAAVASAVRSLTEGTGAA